jgi:hypothetical protein
MCGSPARGSRVERQRLFGWKVIGSVVPVAGYGSQATGSKIRCTLRICFLPFRARSGQKAAWLELCGIIRHLGSEISRNGNKHALPLFEIARVLMRLDHVASFIVNVNHSIM